MTNTTSGQGLCSAPFLQRSNFPGNEGYTPGRFCAPVPAGQGTIECCLPCPISDWVYGDDFTEISRVSNWLNVAGMVCTVSLLITFIVLPIAKTSRHHLTVCFVIAVCILQLAFIIPLGATSEQCHDAITPNDLRSELTCAFSGAFLLFGGFASIMWGFVRTVSLHLQICWKVIPGKKMFWGSLLAGWVIPIIVASSALGFTGVSYRFGDTCHINHNKALQDYWWPILFAGGAAAILQFATFGYCVRVYIRAYLNDDARSTTENHSGLPSHNGSIKTVTTRQAYQRVKKVISLQWRGMVIVVIIIVNVVFLAVVFVSMDNSVQAAKKNLGKAEPWLLCLVLHPTDKNACLEQVASAGLVQSEATVMAVLIMMSLNGIWTIFFLGRVSMITGWIELIKKSFARKNDFVSVDARRFSAGYKVKDYEMITSAPSCSSRVISEMPKEPQTAVMSPSSEYNDSISAVSPQSQPDHFRKELKYVSPTLSFSTPRPPSAGRGGPGREWDPASTHARSSVARPSWGTDNGFWKINEI